jgi:hypothetical protein
MSPSDALRYEASRIWREVRSEEFRWRPALRRLWWIFARRHKCEICQSCGGPVARATPSWWWAPEDLWAAVVGNAAAIRCVPCFTEEARAAGFAVSWHPTVEARLCTGCCRVPESCWCSSEEAA